MKKKKRASTVIHITIRSQKNIINPMSNQFNKTRRQRKCIKSDPIPSPDVFVPVHNKSSISLISQNFDKLPTVIKYMKKRISSKETIFQDIHKSRLNKNKKKR